MPQPSGPQDDLAVLVDGAAGNGASEHGDQLEGAPLRRQPARRADHQPPAARNGHVNGKPVAYGSDLVALTEAKFAGLGHTKARAQPEPRSPASTPAPEWDKRPHRKIHALSRRQRVAYALLSTMWIAAAIAFWLWWLEPSHRGSIALYVGATAALFYQSTVLPSFFWFFVGRMHRPVHVAAPEGHPVAMITLCVPSHESLEIIEAQLRALTEVRYPHDSWVLDEGGSPDIEFLALNLGVKYFTRKGVERYNQPGPPFQAGTKAGNVNAWLDHIRERGSDYELFVQLDIDHKPTPEYLDRTVGYFSDPNVAWVQAPSVSRNLELWAARGQAEQDLVLQGPLQMGFYGHSRTPFIIGSHTTYRTSAIREIGGFQPTRAEDHLDTIVLAANGYTGVYVPEIIAEGNGPENFTTYLGQQFAWAHSMIQVFLQYTPRLIRRYSRAQALQFLACQSWYLLWATSLALLWALPIIGLLSNRLIAAVPLLTFLGYYGLTIVMSTVMWCWSRKWFQPAGLRLTWRGLILDIARWPVVLWAFVNVVLGIKRPYMITPKGAAHHTQGPIGAYGPYFLLGIAAVAAMAVYHFAIGHNAAEGNLVLVVFGLVMTLLLLVTITWLEVRATAVASGDIVAALRSRLLLVGMTVALVGSSIWIVAIVWSSLAQAAS